MENQNSDDSNKEEKTSKKKKHNKRKTAIKNRSESSTNSDTESTAKYNKNSKDVIAENFVLLAEIGHGAFGKIYLTFNMRDNIEVAIKKEKKDPQKIPQLKMETKIYQTLLNIQNDCDISGRQLISQEDVQGIPKFYGTGELLDDYYLILEFLGPNLIELFNYCGQRKFTIGTVCLLALQMLNRIEKLHKCNFIHRDIKPENFLIGTENKSNIIYLVDYGLSKRYKNPKNHQHIPYKEGRLLTGTARYVSINTHLGVEQSRRDDLESIGYVLIFFLKGSLPWQGLKGIDKYTKIMEKKLQIPTEILCFGLPNEISVYLNYCKNLRFEDRPDYDYLRSLFVKEITILSHDYGITKQYLKFDWCFEDKNSVWEIYNNFNHRKRSLTNSNENLNSNNKQVLSNNEKNDNEEKNVNNKIIVNNNQVDNNIEKNKDKEEPIKDNDNDQAKINSNNKPNEEKVKSTNSLIYIDPKSSTQNIDEEKSNENNPNVQLSEESQNNNEINQEENEESQNKDDQEIDNFEEDKGIDVSEEDEEEAPDKGNINDDNDSESKTEENENYCTNKPSNKNLKDENKSDDSENTIKLEFNINNFNDLEIINEIEELNETDNSNLFKANTNTKSINKDQNTSISYSNNTKIKSKVTINSKYEPIDKYIDGIMSRCLLPDKVSNDLKKKSKRVTDTNISDIQYNDGDENCINKYEEIEMKLAKENLIKIKEEQYQKYYEVIKNIGEGSFGSVKKVRHLQLNEVRAMKIVSKGKDSISSKNEIETLRKISHPNIVNIFEIFEDQYQYYIICEYCDGGELFDAITRKGSFSEIEASKIIKQVLQAVNYLHNSGIVHRDLKPENIMLLTNQSNLKLIDFGTVAQIPKKGKKLRKFIGTSYYLAPEVILENYDEKCDVWSVGVIAYILLCGYPPFNGVSNNEIYNAIQYNKPQFNYEEWTDISSDAVDLITKMLNKNPNKRLSAEQCLNHPWFKLCEDNVDIIKINKNKEQIIDKMTRFVQQNKFKQAVLQFISTEFNLKKEEEELKNMFKEFDKEDKGTISREVFIKQIDHIQQGKISIKLISEIFTSLDLDGSGTISYNEFLTSIIDNEKILTEDRLSKAFKLLDKDGNGLLSVDEIKSYFGGEEETWKKVLREVDKNGDGEVDFEEFKILMIGFNPNEIVGGTIK